MNNFTFMIETTCGDKLYFGDMENAILDDYFPILTKRKIKSVTSNLVEIVNNPLPFRVVGSSLSSNM